MTGPASEAPFQISTSWIHPRVADRDVDVEPAAGAWLHRIEKAGHRPISWMEIHRARMPRKDEAALLGIPTSLPVLEIVRVGTSGVDNRPVEVTEYVVASDRAAVSANIGDSRAYLMRDFVAGGSPLVPMSEDHPHQHLVAHVTVMNIET